MVSVLNTIKIPLKIDYKIVKTITPSTLLIDEKLQIGGNYFESIFQMS